MLIGNDVSLSFGDIFVDTFQMLLLEFALSPVQLHLLEHLPEVKDVVDVRLLPLLHADASEHTRSETSTVDQGGVRERQGRSVLASAEASTSWLGVHDATLSL